jgi:predicted transposase YbfD/YdcC
MVRREITMLANPAHITKETAYFIGSVDNVADFARAVRSHWGIESMHWSLDVTFRDDHNKTLDMAAAHNLAIVKRMVFNVLKNETTIKPKMSKPNKRVVAAMDLEYRDHLISQAFNQT